VPPGPVHEAKAKAARGYRWETAAPGNYLSVKSGVGSERIVSRLAGELVEWIVAEHPDLDVGRYRFSVGSWARSEAIVGLLVAYLDQIGVVDDAGPRDSLLTQLRAAERRASEERKELGLNPSAHAALEKRRAEAVRETVDLGALQRRGAEALKRGRELPHVGHLRGDVGHLGDEEDAS
jgi:hypothetical protein